MFFNKKTVQEKQRHIPEETEVLVKDFIEWVILGTGDGSVQWKGNFVGVPQEFISQFKGNKIIFTIQFCTDGPYAFLVVEGNSVRMNYDEAVSLYRSVKEQAKRNDLENLQRSLRKIMSSEG